jgi:hypothetical protein
MKSTVFRAATPDVSEERITSIFKVEEQTKQGSVCHLALLVRRQPDVSEKLIDSTYSSKSMPSISSASRLHLLVRRKPDVSDEHIATIFRVGY